VTATIPQGGLLFGNFSDEFSEIVPNSCHLLTGLGIETSKKAPFCQEEGLFFRIMTTEIVPKGDFSIELMITTPTNHTGSLVMAALSDPTLTGIIAVCDEFYYFVNDKTKKLRYLQALWSNEQRTGARSALSFVFCPNTEFFRIKKGKILVRFPASFSLQISNAPTIDLCNSGFPTLAPQYTYDKQLGLLTVSLPTEFQSIPSTCNSTLEVTKGGSGVVFPELPGEYALELVFHNGFGEVEAAGTWVHVNAKEFLAVSVLPLAREAGTLTVLSLSFTPAEVVPKGVTEKGICGQIVLEFKGEHWAMDLGTDLPDLAKISCLVKEHITAVSDKGLLCTLHHAKQREVPRITIENFNELKADSSILLEIGGIANPSIAGVKPLVALMTVSIKRSIVTVLNWDELALPATLRPSDTPRSLLAAALLTPATVNSATQLRLALMSNFGTSVGAEATLILQLPAQFLSDENRAGCRVQGKHVNCSCFPTSMLIVVYLTERVEAKKEFSLTIRDLYTPKYTVKPGNLYVRLVVNNALAEHVSLPDFPILRTGNITDAQIIVTNSEVGYKDNTYYFLFLIENPLEIGSKIRVHFPEQINLTNISPDCSLTEVRSVKQDKTDCRAISDYVEIDPFYVIERSSLIIKISHVPNPDLPGMTGYFSVETLSEQFLLIDVSRNIQSSMFDPASSKPSLSITTLRTSPSNRNIIADIVIAFLPSRDIPAETVLCISLPASEYPELPKSVEYKLSGGLKGQDVSRTEGSTLEIVLEKMYH
jgi:hypothetical protein